MDRDTAESRAYVSTRGNGRLELVMRADPQAASAVTDGVVRLLQEQGVSADKLSAAGYGEYRPIASNKSSQGKSLNRRIEIVLAPEDQAPGIKNRSASR